MSENNNQETKRPDNRDRKKAVPSVPAAKGVAKTPGTQPKTEAGARKPGSSVPPATATGRRPATSDRPQVTMSARALTRYEKDQRRQRYLIWATIGIVVFVVLVLAVGIWQTTLGPNFQTLAQVGDQSISRADYNKFRKNDLFKQSGQIQSQLQFAQGDQQTQLQSQLSLIQDEVLNITDRPVNQSALELFVSQLVLEKAAKDKFGISVSDDEVNQSLTQEFKDVIYTPTANPTQVIQTATAGVVATQGSTFSTATAGAITPLPTPTPSVSPTATVTVSGTVTTGSQTPGPTQAGSLTPGPTAVGSPGAAVTATTTISATVAPTVTPTATATATAIAANLVQQTASANQNSFLDSYKKFTSLSEDDYKRFEAKPTLLKKKVIEKLQASQPKIGDPYPSWRVSHILVADEATANQIYDQLKALPADQLNDAFVKLAREKSTDTTSAAQNGDLGWITDKTSFVQEFKDAALKMHKGELSKPVKSQFGYHIIYCTDEDPKRPLDALTIQGFQSLDNNGDPQFYSDWLKDQVKAAGPKYNTPPTPTPVPTVVPAPVFTPVIPPTATPLPTATPVPTSPGATTTAGGSPAPGATTAAATTAAATTAAATTAATTPTIAATTAAATPAAATPSPTK